MKMILSSFLAFLAWEGFAYIPSDNREEVTAEIRPDSTWAPPKYESDKDEEVVTDKKPESEPECNDPNPDGLRKYFAGDIPQDVSELMEFLTSRGNKELEDQYTRLGIEVPKGILLYGPPGTGKTTLAKAIANASGAKFIAVSGAEFMNKYVGDGPEKIRGVFQEARNAVNKGKCHVAMIFIDEIDAIAPQRTGDAQSQYMTAYINTLLTEMDGFAKKTPVLVIGATNRIDTLDSAILRPGRFDRKILIDLPNQNQRESIYRFYLTKLATGDINYELISEASEGFSAAEIHEVTKLAGQNAFNEKAKQIETKHLIHGINRIIGSTPGKETF